MHVYRGRASATPLAWKLVSQAGLAVNEAGDRFGAALAIGRIDNDGLRELVVGAPAETPGSSDTVLGEIYVFRGSATGLVPWQAIGHGTLLPEQDGDDLGATLVLGNFDGSGMNELVVSVSDHEGSAGAVIYFDFVAASAQLVGQQVLTQSSVGAFAD